MEKEDIKIDGTYFYNNGPVKILKFETDTFVFVEALNNIHTDLEGSNFCYACNIGADCSTRHTCEETAETISEIIDSMIEKQLFWVDIKHLQKEPVEYKTWKKINEAIIVLKEEKERLIMEKKAHLSRFNQELRKEATFKTEIERLHRNHVILVNAVDTKQRVLDALNHKIKLAQKNFLNTQPKKTAMEKALEKKVIVSDIRNLELD